MEPVIHRCHLCIGGEVGADSSNHLSSNEQVCVGKIEVGISCSRYHEFYWTPPPPPPSRETSKVGVLPSDPLLYSSASVARRKDIVRSSHPHTIVGVRTPYYENTSVRCRRLMGVTRRRGAARFIRFTRLPGGGGVLRMLYIRFLPAAVALRFAAFLTFLPATTSPAICAPVVSARFPKATSPLLIRGATVRRRPLNTLPNPCPLCTVQGRVAVSESQVVDADHNDRVQDNDLTKEHDFFLGTLGAEEMPTVRGVYDVLNTARGCHCHSLI